MPPKKTSPPSIPKQTKADYAQSSQKPFIISPKPKHLTWYEVVAQEE